MPTQRKILTVVLLSAGCGATAARPKVATPAPAPAPAPTRVPVPAVAASEAKHEPVLTAVSMTPPAPVARSRPALDSETRAAIKSDNEQPENLLQLRSELYRSDELTINVANAKFRALCDEHGYPVVGNVASKSMRHDVSSYCEDVRTQLVMR